MISTKRPWSALSPTCRHQRHLVRPQSIEPLLGLEIGKLGPLVQQSLHLEEPFGRLRPLAHALSVREEHLEAVEENPERLAHGEVEQHHAPRDQERPE